MKIFITRRIPQVGLDMLEQAGHEIIVSEFDRPLSRDELKQKTVGSDAILSQLVDGMDGEIMDAAGQQLKIVANYAVGFDNINLKDAEVRHVLVTNTPFVSASAVADHAFGLMIAAARWIVNSDKFVREGKYQGWDLSLFLGQDIFGKTLGIIGTGQIGSMVAKRAAKGFEMKVLYYDVVRNEKLEQETSAKFVPLDELLKASDFISVHVPLLPQTKHLIAAPQFELMKKTCVFVNTSRGPVVDENALVAALQKGDIFSAGIDVYENEPNLAPGLIELPNVVLTPHIASATPETRNKMAEVAAENIIVALKGDQPPNLVKAI